jgi:HK97 family phage major capsid protein
METLVATAEAANRDLEEAEQTRFDALREEVRSLDARIARATALAEAERSMPAVNGGGDSNPDSWGARLTGSAEYRAFIERGHRGTARVETRAITTASTSAGEMITPDRQAGVVMLPKRRLTIRALLAPGRTDSKSVEYVRQTGFVNAAAPVAEGAQKPESSITFETESAPTKVIAHWVPVSRQAMDDAAGLQSLIDVELRYGLAFAEEDELLNGDGTGEHLKRLLHSDNRTAYETARDVAGDNKADTLLHAIEKAEVAELPASGIVLNTSDWFALMGLKDENGAYLAGGPWVGQAARTLWDLPIVATPAMDAGTFLVGAFATAAQVFDRLLPEVLVSSEDRDNFIKNMLTVRAEERVALAVKRPEALIFGSFPEEE